MHTLHPIPLDPPLAIQKPSKESGIFQSLGTANFIFFPKRQSQKGEGGHGPMLPAPKYASVRSLLSIVFALKILSSLFRITCIFTA